MKTTEFDEVLYTQLMFRECLNAMSRPGSLGHVVPPSCTLKDGTLSPYLAGLAMTLLDQEVTFHIDRGAAEEISMIQLHTMSRVAPITDCDYFFTNGIHPFQVSMLKKGTLATPDQSCTILCSVRKIDCEEFNGFQTVRLALQGPGIEHESAIYIEGLCHDTLKEWKEGNCEFPLGHDWILVDEKGCICAIPRSSRMEWRIL